MVPYSGVQIYESSSPLATAVSVVEFPSIISVSDAVRLVKTNGVFSSGGVLSLFFLHPNAAISVTIMKSANLLCMRIYLDIYVP